MSFSVSSASGPASSSMQIPLHDDPQAILREMNNGCIPQGITLTIASKKTYEALQCCGSYGPAGANEDAAQNFYDWEKVVYALLEKGENVTDEAKTYASLIGRGMPEKMANASSWFPTVLRYFRQLSGNDA